MRQILSRASLLVALAGCKANNQLDAPLPVATGPLAVDSALTLSPSHIDVPVEYDLGPALAWLEETLPLRMGDMEERLETPGNDRLSFAFNAERTPFQLRLNGTTATLSSVVTYGGRGWYKPPILPTVSGSCGLESDTPPRVRITVRSTVTPTANWQLRANSSVTEIVPLTEEARDQCVVTFAQINVTERVLEAVRGVLDKELDKVDAQLAIFDLRGRVDDIWSFLGTPMRLQDSLWLVMDPTAIRLGQVRNEGTTLHTSVGITAYPRVIGGPRPAAKVRDTPPLERGGGGDGLSLLSEGRIGWDVLTGILQRELTGDTIEVAGRHLEIVDVTVLGLDDGRVAVGLTVSGAAHGTAYLVGRPVFDPHEAMLTMPDLEFDVSSRSLMVAGLAWLAEGKVEEYLRTSLRISLASVLTDGLALMERELTRELATGVTLATTVTGGQVYRVRPRREALMVDAVAQGTAQMRIQLVPGRKVSQDSVGVVASRKP
ncbi:MAG TPA: DUF4403 family protein [Gemmatimonadales bacterium]|nr:DUF4403 family protein [Gemmatimonadales bacterium]